TACAQVWTDTDYRIMVDGIHDGLAEWLTADRMRARCRVMPATLRSWASRGQVRTRKTAEGRTEYSVADTVSMRDKAHGRGVQSATEAGATA
ncbi:MAG: hypothetical protein ACRCYU_14545, partial [Nocardioides sp.]